MIVLGMVMMALAGAVIPAWLLFAASNRDDGRTTTGLSDWQPTDRHCGPSCTCRGGAPWS